MRTNLIADLIDSWARTRCRRASRKAWQAGEPEVALTRIHADPNSGMYAIHPSCGYGFWRLYAPGSYTLDEPWPTKDHEPVAVLPDNDPSLPSYDPICEGPGIESPTLAEMSGWISAWVEQVTGREVVDIAHGWSAPYGEDGDAYEYTVFVETRAVPDQGGRPVMAVAPPTAPAHTTAGQHRTPKENRDG